jgi:predicted dehydrogenase
LHRLAESVGRVYTATATVRTADTATGWRADSVRAGGGVLLNGSYDIVDMLVQLLGLPQAVYAQCTMAPASGSSGKYDTEDVAILSLTFGVGEVGCVTARRGAPHWSWEIALVGTHGCIDLMQGRFVITSNDGAPSQCYTAESDHFVRSAIRAFGVSWNSTDMPFESTGEQHLATVATIESAYLSAKTGAPESPGRLLG